MTGMNFLLLFKNFTEILEISHKHYRTVEVRDFSSSEIFQELFEALPYPTYYF